MGRPLKIAKAQAVITITATAAATDIVTTSSNLTNLGIIAGMPFIPASNVGNLVAGTTYWILEVLSATTFTVSATQLSANPTYAKFDLAAAGPVTVAATVGLVDSGFNNPIGSANTYGVVGGNTAFYGPQTLVGVCMGIAGTGTISASTAAVAVTGTGTAFTTELAVGSILTDSDGNLIGEVAVITDDTNIDLVANSELDLTDESFIYGTAEAGFIVRQRGKTKYLVTGATTGLTQACYTANVANAALTPNTFNIIATYADTSTAFVRSLNDYQTEVFPAQVAASALVQGTVYTIYSAGNTNWTAVGAFANMSGITFTATGAGSGTGTAVLSNVYPDVISSFNAAAVANVDIGQPQEIVTINNA